MTLQALLFLVVASAVSQQTAEPPVRSQAEAQAELDRFFDDRVGFFMRHDLDGDEKLSRPEFDNATEAILLIIQQAGVTGWGIAGRPKLFDILDTNEDGFVQRKEIDEEKIKRYSGYHAPKKP